MDDIIEIYDSDSNDCTVTSHNTSGVKRKLEDSDSYSDTEYSSDDDHGRLLNVEPILVDDSESETECECDEWDNDCEVCEVIPKTDPLHGFFLMPTCVNDPELQPKSLPKDVPELRTTLEDEKFVSEFRSAFNGKHQYGSNNVEFVTNPFRVCVVKDFLEDSSFLVNVREEFNDVKWHKRNLDLYEFFQSDDLKHVNDLKHIKAVHGFLRTKVLAWISKLTGYSLTHVSATCSLYSDTDYLLVHDDRQDDRMVAYVMYFTGKDDWNPKHGGALQLFSKDSNGQPLDAVRDVFPANNQLVFFPVTNDSYHQVSEITCKNDCRMSINGWFHVSTPPVFEIPPFIPPSEGVYGTKAITQQSIDIDLDTWISPYYLNPPAVREIQGQMEEDSEISLRKYFKDEPFNEVLECLQYEGVKWKRVGPPSRRWYEVLVEDHLPHVLDRFLKLFRSSAMFSLLSKYTELELRTDKASMKYELQRWTPGCYSILTDYDWQQKELDVIIYLGCSRSSSVVGGQTLYVSTDEQIQSALITLEPQENNLNIVFRDTARITKYVSKQSMCKCFYMLVCSYSE